MATRQTRARTPTRSSSEVSTAPNPAPFVPRRIVMDYIDINDIVPYDWNPRDNSKAVQSVANSIRLTHGMAQPRRMQRSCALNRIARSRLTA
jgi:hypothetical protein